MHVLQLGPYPPPQGGVNRNMLAISDELVRNGHRCSIIATTRSREIIPEPDVYHPKGPFELLKLLLTLKYDVLHLHVGGDLNRRVLALIAGCGLLARGKNVLTLHSGAYPGTDAGKAAGRSSIRGFMFRQFSRVIAVNPLIADVFERYGVSASRLRTILPFVLKRPDSEVKLPPDLARFADAHSPFLLTVGLLEPEYDLLMQVDAMRKMIEIFPNAGLMIVGSGSIEDELRKSVNSKAYSPHIVVAGDVDHSITLHLINDCDLLLRTTLFDGDAISIREALFLGTPVIATDNGMRPAGVHLIEAGNADDLVANVRSALEQSGTKQSGSPEDNANITSVVELYGEITAQARARASAIPPT